MKNHYPKLLLCILLLLPLGLYANAENENRLTAAINRAHNAGTIFKKFDLFAVTTGDKHAILEKEVLLQPVDKSIKALYETRPEAVSVSFTSAEGVAYTLEMLRSNPTAAIPNFGVINRGARQQMNVSNAIHYQGAVAGSEKSLATMSVFADGTVMILFGNSDGNFIVGKLQDASGKYVFYNDRDMKDRPNTPCGVSAEDYKDEIKSASAQAKGTGVNLCNKVSLYWECDYEYFVAKSSNITTAQNYMVSLFNQVQAMYRNENISVELKSLYIWTTNDAYPKAESRDGLYTFRAYWNALGDSYDGDLAHFITMDNNYNGGVAYVDVMDASVRTFSYAYSEIQGAYLAVPTYSWDVEVVTHETGHNFGSNHTQWCGWKTNSGSCGSIDNCVAQEQASSVGCSSCSYKQFDNALPSASWRGTVMSYCHLVSRGIDLANGFGPLPGDRIRDNVNTTANLKSIYSVTLTPKSICGPASGGITLTFDTARIGSKHFGVAPYTYSWSNGGNTQSVTGISNPGTYTVSISDSNGCTGTFSADVAKYPTSGNGQALTHAMPICCNNPVTVNLTATVPTDLQSCQTVAWLRTTSPVTTYAAAQTAFATADTADIIYSTNASSVNVATAATLSATSPVACTGLQTFYYTPFVTRKARTTNTITSSAAASGTTNPVAFDGGVQSGNFATLSDQTGSATGCDLLDTARVKDLLVTVTNYTGRSGMMTILVMDVAGMVLHRTSGAAGNGTYTIPVIGYNPLQELSVAVFDFNCQGEQSSATCIGATATVNVSRTVTYDSITKPRIEPACTVGTSIMLSFAPTDCTPLGLDNIAMPIGQLDVYPNPTSKNATLAFMANGNGAATLKITDMVGRVIEMRSVNYTNGRNAIGIDVQGYAKGVYFLAMDTENANTVTSKLVVE